MAGALELAPPKFVERLFLREGRLGGVVLVVAYDGLVLSEFLTACILVVIVAVEGGVLLAFVVEGWAIDDGDDDDDVAGGLKNDGTKIDPRAFAFLPPSTRFCIECLRDGILN
jgi:hypothetical protein